MAGKPAIVMVIVVALIVFPQWTSNGEDAPSAKPFIEYEDELPGYGNFVSNDTDGDDQLEIFYYRQDGYMVAFDPPSYSRVLNLERTYPGFFPIFKDLGMNGSTEIIIFYKGAGHFNCSIISGKTFLELWRSPDIEGKASFPETGDVDCDGHMEVVWCAYEQVPGRIYVFDAVSNKMDWVSPKIMGLPTSYVDVTLKNIDEDPAQEIILEYKTSLLEVYDGATFELQWAIRSNEGSYFWTPNDFIRDFDDDGETELLILHSEINATGGSIFWFGLCSGESGAVEWNMTFAGNNHSDIRFGDIDGDGGIELLETTRGGNNMDSSEYLFEIYDLEEHRSLMRIGPIAHETPFNSWMYANDLDGDGVAEVIFSNTSVVNYTDSHFGFDSSFQYHTYQVMDGRDFGILWTSPKIGGNSDYMESVRLTENEPPVILLAGYSNENGTYKNGTVSIFSTDDYREIWVSEPYPGIVTACLADCINVSRKELLISFDPHNGEGKKFCLYETLTYSLTWTSPNNLHSEYYWSLDGDDLFGSSYKELIFVNESPETVHTGNSTNIRTFSTISVFNDTTFKEVWRSEKLAGQYHIVGVWDFDNDSNMEAVFYVPYVGFVDVNSRMIIYEFPRKDDWPTQIDEVIPHIQIHSPLDGASVRGDSMIFGTAWDDRAISTVEVRIDAKHWQNASLVFNGTRESCNWSISWNVSGLSEGRHTIRARSFDGFGGSLEAAVNVTVPIKDLPPAMPKTPTTSAGPLAEPACVAFLVICLVVAVTIILSVRKR